MKLARLLTVMVVGLVSALVGPSVLAKPGIDKFISPSHIRDLDLSPDGKRLAMIRKGPHEDYLLTTWTIDGGADQLTVLEQDHRGSYLTGVRWVDDERLVVTITHIAEVDGHAIPVSRMTAMDADGGNAVRLMANIERLQSNPNLTRFASNLPFDPDHVLMYGFESTWNLYKVNLHSGAAKRVERGTKWTYRWRVNRHGEVKLRYDYRPVSRVEKVYVQGDEGWERIARFRRGEGTYDSSFLSKIGLNKDDDLIMFGRKNGDEYAGLYTFNPESQEIEKRIFGVDGYDVFAAIEHPYTHDVVGAVYIDDRPRYHFFDDRLQAIQGFLENKFRHGRVSIASVSRRLDRVLFLTQEPWRPGRAYLYNRNTRTIEQIGDFAPQFEKPISKVEILSYKTFDGAEIRSYLTLPASGSKRNLPVIVYPHGGPFTRDYLAFDPIVQFWASRGYAVFQPNFRGSSGFGVSFEKAGYKQYGERMIDDIAHGMRTLIAKGYADRERMCVVGASYGGYAALTLSARYPELVQCAASINGLTDLPYRIERVVDLTKRSGEKEDRLEYFNETMGSLEDERRMLERQSPVNLANRIQAPVLLMHATDDQNVDFEHSARMRAALTEAEKSVSFLPLESGGHGLNDVRALKRVMIETTSFVAEHVDGEGP